MTKLGKCPNCGEFGSFIEEKNIVDKKGKHGLKEKGSILQNKNVESNQSIFFKLKNTEFQRVLHKGVKKGGMYLLGGEPGIGKSTLILQILEDLINMNEIKIGYFSGEEQENQIRTRIQRLFKKNINIEVFTSSSLEDILFTSQEKNFDMIIVDSIQTIYSQGVDSFAGSPNQVKFCSEKLSEFSKLTNTTMLIIGHVTKGGEIAGPKYLEHIVDVVLYLEGDRFGQLRFLRNKKNRFGPTDDSGIFEMTLFGLQPVYDLKKKILEQANTKIPGSILTIGLDNGRPVLINLEVLLNKTKYKFPQKNCIGVSSKRVDLIVAILEKYLGLNLSFFDIFVNIPGEFYFGDSGIDLAIALGIYSQYKNKIIGQNNIYIGELGLGGQVVKTKFHNKRLKEIPNGFEFIDYEKIKHISKINY